MIRRYNIENSQKTPKKKQGRAQGRAQGCKSKRWARKNNWPIKNVKCAEKLIAKI